MVAEISSQKIGLAPGTIKYTGSVHKDRIKLTTYVYKEDFIETKEFYDWSELTQYLQSYNDTYIKWINVDGINHIPLIEKIGETYNIHNLTLEDIVHVEQRPKFEEFNDYLLCIFRAFYAKETNNESTINPNLYSEQLSLVLNQNNTLISFQEKISIDPFDHVRKRLQNNKSKLRRSKADYLLYALLDAVVDYYFLCIEKLSDRTEALETEIIKNKEISLSSKNLYKIYRLKKEIIQIRKVVWPMRDMINSILHNDNEMISENTKFYMRDVYDHIVRIIDSIETQRDLISGLIDFYLSLNANKMNEIMKFLTIISTLFIPVTFIAGIYGMNFEYMPELKHPYGYYIIIVVMLLIISWLLFYFKRKKWI
ncbi:MAG: magnesium transport protein CorA [Bacteroidia bacterium]|nr:MAG: magnesium transport protein CorA [Bacteroidia bacterium]